MVWNDRNALANFERAFITVLQNTVLLIIMLIKMALITLPVYLNLYVARAARRGGLMAVERV